MEGDARNLLLVRILVKVSCELGARLWLEEEQDCKVRCSWGLSTWRVC